MSWEPPARTPEAVAIYEAADADRATRPERYDLGPDAAARVVERAGTGEPDAATREGLSRYLASAAADGRLNALGSRMVLDTATGRLKARRAIDDADGGHDLAAPPIVIVGGWRTGTTFLFRALATDPRLRAPLPAELTAPWRFAGVDDDERERRIDAGAAAHDFLHLLNPRLAAVHDSGARLPEECVLALGTTMRNWGFSSTVRLDSYSDWLATQDLADEYRRHRRVLELLDRGDGRRWVLKAPAHTAELPNLLDAFPGALVVHLHRDVVETIASGASLFATFRSTYSDDVDPHDVGRFLTDQTERWSARAAGVPVLDVEYDDLVREPASVLATIHESASLPPPADLDAFVAAYHEANPRHAHGVHRYAPEDFGLDPDAIRSRFARI